MAEECRAAAEVYQQFSLYLSPASRHGNLDGTIVCSAGIECESLLRVVHDQQPFAASLSPARASWPSNFRAAAGEHQQYFFVSFPYIKAWDS